MLQAVLLDLDDTLLANDMEVFVPAYLKRLSEVVQDELSPDKFQKVLLASTRAMFESDDLETTNSEVFWSTFSSLARVDQSRLKIALTHFYRNIFPSLKAHTAVVPGALELARYLRARGVKTALATNPIFPRVAIVERLSWAGLGEESFDLITSYENSRATKPRPGYYEQILQELDSSAECTLMVGNDLAADIEPAVALGMHSYLVEDASKSHGTRSESRESNSLARSFAAESRSSKDDERGTLEALLNKLQAGWLSE